MAHSEGQWTLKPGDELPPDFTSQRLAIVTEQNNADIFAKITKASSGEKPPKQTDIERAKRRAPKVSFRVHPDPSDTFFERPDVYIRTIDQLPDEVEVDDSLVEYELDSDDERFLAEQNAFCDDSEVLTEDAFELLMDRLEKEVFLHSEQNGGVIADANEAELQEAADASDCVVCLEGLSEDTNQIIFCDGCDIAVHQCCYGVEVIPEGENVTAALNAICDDLSVPQLPPKKKERRDVSGSSEERFD